MNYKVLKPFFKLSEKTNYSIGDIIELSKEDAKAMISEGFLEETKTKEVTEKPKVVSVVHEVITGKFSTKIKQDQDND